MESGKEVRLHEIQYPIMQGWDSVEIRADVELGGTDQLFNILVGRDLQKEQGMLPQIAMTMPLLGGWTACARCPNPMGTTWAWTKRRK